MKTIKKLLCVILAGIMLTSCGSKYKVKVDLTPEQRDAIEREISQITEYLDNYNEKDIPGPSVVDLARDYEKLGNLGKAIDIYEDWLKNARYKVPLFLNNLAKLYEKVDEPELAVEQYRYLIDTYQQETYLYDIAWVYINTKNIKEAEKYFNLWQLKFQKTDEQTQLAIKKLREEAQQAE